MTTFSDEYWMARAIELARRAESEGEVPVGAVLVLDNQVIGEGYNRPIQQHDPAAHAEVMAMRHAGQSLANYRLNNSTLYVTLEPCMMCAGAMLHARIARLVYGASDPKTGIIDSVMQLLQQPWLNHRIDVTANVLQQDCSDLLKAFFKAKRGFTSLATKPKSV